MGEAKVVHQRGFPEGARTACGRREIGFRDREGPRISAETVNTLKQDEKFRIGASAFSSLAGKMRIPDVDVSALRKEFMNIYRHGFVRVAACRRSECATRPSTP